MVIPSTFHRDYAPRDPAYGVGRDSLPRHSYA